MAPHSQVMRAALLVSIGLVVVPLTEATCISEVPESNATETYCATCDESGGCAQCAEGFILTENSTSCHNIERVVYAVFRLRFSGADHVLRNTSLTILWSTVFGVTLSGQQELHDAGLRSAEVVHAMPAEGTAEQGAAEQGASTALAKWRRLSNGTKSRMSTLELHTVVLLRNNTDGGLKAAVTALQNLDLTLLRQRLAMAFANSTGTTAPPDLGVECPIGDLAALCPGGEPAPVSMSCEGPPVEWGFAALILVPMAYVARCILACWCRKRRERLQAPELREQIRNVTRRTKLQVLEKSAAILVALAWTGAIGSACTGTGSKILAAIVAYACIWVLGAVSTCLLHSIALEQVTLLAAELVAFLWRDATLALFAVICTLSWWPSSGASALVLVWVLILLVVGVAWLTVAGYVRRRAASMFRGDAGWPKRFEEFMADVEIDVNGLTVGYTLLMALGFSLFGEEWKEVIAQGENVNLYLFVVLGVLAGLLAVLIFNLLQACGAHVGGARYKMVVASSGFFGGFLLNNGYRMVFRMPFESIIYPFLMLSLGAVHVARSSTAVRRADPNRRGCCGLLGPKSVDLWRDVTILAYQMCMALAFEGLLDACLEELQWKTLSARFAFAGAVLAFWMLLCAVLVTLKIGEEPEEEEEEGAEAPSGTLLTPTSSGTLPLAV